jgi:chromosome segregation ATPase
MVDLPVPCPACNKTTPVRPDWFGKVITCGHCQKPFRVSQFTRVPCPQCHQEVRLRPEHIGERVTCKFCAYTFYVVPPQTAAPQMADGADENQRLRERVAGLEAELHRIQNDLAPKEEPSSRMIVQLEETPDAVEAKALRKELDKVRTQVERLRGQCQALEAHKAAAGRLASEVEALRAERDQLNQRNKAHTTETAQLKTKLADIGRTMAAAAKRQHDAELHITQLDGQRLRLELDRQTGEEQRRLVQAEVESLRQERDAARTEITGLREQAKGWEREREALLAQWHQDHSQKVDALEKQMREEQARALAEQDKQLMAVRSELEQHRQALTEMAEKTRQEADVLRQERDASREQAEARSRQSNAEQQALRNRLSEVAQQSLVEQERLQMELGRSEAARRQVEQEFQTAHANGERMRSELDALHREQESARAEAEQQHRSLTEDLQRGQRERHAFQEQAHQTQQEAEKLRQAELAEMRRDFEEECALLKEEVGQHKAEIGPLRQEREALRRRIETMQEQARERADKWQSERTALLAKAQQEQQRAAEVDKQCKAAQATTAELREQLEAEREAAPANAAQLRKEGEDLRRELENTRGELAQARQQIEQRGQGWTVEKRSLLAHQQDECRRLTEEFEQRLRVELTRCREGYEDQLEALQRERDAARSHFEALKQAVYHPAQAREDDGIPRLPEPAEESGDGDRSAMEQRLIAEQAQLQSALRKNRQLLEEQKRQFEEERQALLAEVHRLRQRTGGGRTSGLASAGAGLSPGVGAVAVPRTSRVFKFFLYLMLFLLATGAVVMVSVVIKFFGHH